VRLLNFSKRNVLQSEMRTNRLLLTRPVADDYKQWKNLREISRDHLQPFEPQWSGDELTRRSFKSRLRQVDSDYTSERGLHWFLKLTTEQHDVVGGISLTNIRRGVAQTGTLGYWIGAPYQRQGLMTSAVCAIAPYVFDVLRLHRIEAACLPNNEASTRLLVKAGFGQEDKVQKTEPPSFNLFRAEENYGYLKDKETNPYEVEIGRAHV